MESENYQNQQDEVEALQSIFDEEFYLLSENPFKFQIIVKGNRDHFVNSKSMMLGVLLTIELPPDYPNTAATFTVRKASDMYLSEDELLLIDDLFRESLESNIGEPQIFEACERVREFL